MKLHHILTAAVVALATSIQAIEPASAQMQVQYSPEQDRLFLQLATGLFARFGEPNYYRGSSAIPNAHMTLGKTYCGFLNLGGRSMEEFRQDGEDLFAQGDEEQATMTWVILAAAIGAYCPQHYQEYREVFSQP